MSTVTDWIATARRPKTGWLYTEMVYQPVRPSPKAKGSTVVSMKNNWNTVFPPKP